MSTLFLTAHPRVPPSGVTYIGPLGGERWGRVHCEHAGNSVLLSLSCMATYIYTRTVEIYGPKGHAHTLARLTASKRQAKRWGWRPGWTHSKRVGETRYVFHDGRRPRRVGD